MDLQRGGSVCVANGRISSVVYFRLVMLFQYPPPSHPINASGRFMFPFWMSVHFSLSASPLAEIEISLATGVP